MITLTGLKGQETVLQVGTICEIKNVPDTVVVMQGGNCLMVRETAEEVLDKIVAERKLGEFWRL